MNHLVYFKTYEAAEQVGIIPSTNVEALTTYHKCNKCHKPFYVFNEIVSRCKNCNSTDITEISVFDYYADIKQNFSSEEFKKELKNKKKRDDTMVDLVSLGDYNKIKQAKRNIN